MRVVPGWEVACVSALLVASPGCSDDDASNAPIDDVLIREYVDALCAAASACDCTEERAWDDEAGCLDLVNDSMRSSRLAARSGGALFDESCARQRIDVFATLECKTDAELRDELEPAPCEFFTGEQSDGEPCESYGPAGSNCVVGLSCAFGTCVDPSGGSASLLQEGETCRDQNHHTGQCGANLYCSASTSACEPVPLPGDPCSTHDECVAEGFKVGWCDGDVCAPIKDPSEPCTDDAQCSQACDDGMCTAALSDPLACYGFLL